MSKLQKLFLDHVGQTSTIPLMLEVAHAEGVYIYDPNGKKYIDFNSGISVSSLGHCHPAVVKAIHKQSGLHMHTMVYGEHIQTPQVRYASLLTSKLDSSLNAIYFLMSGTEAVEAAIKLSRRHTGRREIIACKHAYHGSTIGAESLRSDEDYKRAFSPLMPGVRHIRFNQIDDLDRISHETACVVLEPVQAEAGVLLPEDNYLKKVKQRCKEVGALMVLDEIQTGFGRTGKLFAHMQFGFTPDILLVGKAMGGGMPISGVVADQRILNSFTSYPALGHITTFGGHPVSCAAAEASLNFLLSSGIFHKVTAKSNLIKSLLKHKIVKEIRACGMLMAIEFTKRKYLKHVVSKSFELGLLVDWFLFNDRSIRMAPPLVITEEEIKQGCEILVKAFDFAQSYYQR